MAEEPPASSSMNPRSQVTRETVGGSADQLLEPIEMNGVGEERKDVPRRALKTSKVVITT